MPPSLWVRLRILPRIFRRGGVYTGEIPNPGFRSSTGCPQRPAATGCKRQSLMCLSQLQVYSGRQTGLRFAGSWYHPAVAMLELARESPCPRTTSSSIRPAESSASYLSASIGFAATGVWMVKDPASGPAIILFGLAGIALFGVGAVLCLLRILSFRALLSAGIAGIAMNSSGFHTRSFRWSEIDRIEATSPDGMPQIEILLSSHVRPVTAVPTRWLPWPRLAHSPRHVVIRSTFLAGDLADLAELLESRRLVEIAAASVSGPDGSSADRIHPSTPPRNPFRSKALGNLAIALGVLLSLGALVAFFAGRLRGSEGKWEARLGILGGLALISLGRTLRSPDGRRWRRWTTQRWRRGCTCATWKPDRRGRFQTARESIWSGAG